MTPTPKASPTMEQLPELRRKTEAIARLLSGQLAEHFETLRPLFAPERIFGKCAGSKTDVPGTEKALADLQQSYRPFTAKPYDLPGTFDPSWLPLIGQTLALEPWDYEISVGGKTIHMTSPVKWAVVYRSNYTLAQVKRVLNGSEVGRLDFLRQSVVNALALVLALNRAPKIKDLFAHLHWSLQVETAPGLGGLPLVTATSILPSFRPADELILAATSFSGISAFIELIDIQAVHQVKDTLVVRIEEMLK
jgi:hypothetical protein